MKTIYRKEYMDRLIRLKNTPDIKIITGIRRAGKSKLMESFIDYIKTNENNANVIYVDFYDLDFDDLKEYKALNTYVKKKIKKDKRNYLFIDEVQLCPNFEKTVNSLHNSGELDIYIAGSNAFLLSSDLSTLFTGRYIEIQVFPFSFKEYCEYNSNNKDINELFEKYTIVGGLAGSYVYENETDRVEYLKAVFSTIVNRDLVEKYNLPDTAVLDHLAQYMMDNISNITSPNKISTNLNNNLISTNHVTIGRYIKYLCNAFVFYDIKRYDIKGKAYLDTADKFYLCDLGLRFAELGNKNIDYGRCYENIVCIELLRRGYDVYIGKLYQKEVDFIAIRGNDKIYYQVSDDISNQSTFEREVSPLLQIKDAYPKVILARTKHPEYQYEGIKIIDISQWLLN